MSHNTIRGTEFWFRFLTSSSYSCRPWDTASMAQGSLLLSWERPAWVQGSALSLLCMCVSLSLIKKVFLKLIEMHIIKCMDGFQNLFCTKINIPFYCISHEYFEAHCTLLEVIHNGLLLNLKKEWNTDTWKVNEPCEFAEWRSQTREVKWRFLLHKVPRTGKSRNSQEKSDP